ncbi:TetR/AcrR family transcriptional regulator [Cupriavidus taiwanensis]|uniref:TetR/AcrR family transcriptional regulator n=1 Tax=Cupriavidus taiwanensis TaxID=164546 RepID=UPI000E100280|nr:TetR/AcrR family transcriptional regulator C-terminal domain-containing protein [Cupriavidus taiwanensis]SOY61691.1 putative transcriptional regulator, TetR C_term domain [Cupriavidus taiwanensis]SOY63128.1 putative transcriptional regulator, TetR C_term domain [Cupriavidus taiwanensis]SOY98177.1 putative transcriptional regulator, TetR C_term domain [Cupriavidus taiwanensis]SOZ77240.1 putative transcriptional regulator, TetR C_term domain [Cupriavidus taiwanensis]SOZ85256.1 putative transc
MTGKTNMPAARRNTTAAAATGGKAPVAPSAPRRRGRPPKTDSPIGAEPMLSRVAILQHAIKLTKSMPLDQISMVQLAKDFGVAPGLIHYYLGGRDQLVSGVLNDYYRQRVGVLPSLTGDWRADVEGIARLSFEVAVENPGVSIYVASHNRYRLFQDVEPGETDYGLEFFNRMTSAIMQGGFTAEQVALGYHLIAQYLVSASMAEASRQLPAYHQAFIEKKLESASGLQYPGARFVSKAFSRLSSDIAFEEGLRITLDGIEAWKQQNRQPARKSRSRAA